MQHEQVWLCLPKLKEKEFETFASDPPSRVTKKTAHQKLANHRSVASRPLKIPEKQAEARLVVSFEISAPILRCAMPRGNSRDNWFLAGTSLLVRCFFGYQRASFPLLRSAWAALEGTLFGRVSCFRS